MKPARRFLWLGGFLCFVGLILIFDLWIFSPYPSERAVRGWEETYRREVSNHVSRFQGHLVGDDTTFLLYSYHHTAASLEAHQTEIIESLAAEWKVIQLTAETLHLAHRADSAKRWTWLFTADVPLVTVLYLNHHPVSAHHERLLQKARQQHQRRLMLNKPT